MNDLAKPPQEDVPRLGEIGLHNYPPYLMNRIMGRYNASLRDDMGVLGLTTPKMRALAVLSVIDGIQIRQLAGNHTLKLIQFLAREGSSKEIQNA